MYYLDRILPNLVNEKISVICYSSLRRMRVISANFLCVKSYAEDKIICISIQHISMMHDCEVLTIILIIVIVYRCIYY